MKLLLLAVCTVLAGCAEEAERQRVQFPIKIGLLADSQLTSHNGFSNYSYRSKLADRMVGAAIRPPAIECLLSKEMLQIALKKLTHDANGPGRGVDVILYLGDGTNSGGTDEIETFLSILDKHRRTTGIPIFVVIGNHDYLGCGNIATPGTRFALLNRDGRPSNPALSKYQVLKRISEFNHTNSTTTSSRWKYVDNYEAVERNKELDHTSGLYLGGVLSYSEPGKSNVEIFLLDTSDYKDAPDWASLAKWGFYGVIGSLSFKDEERGPSQASYFKQFATASSPDFRLLASHYPKDHLDRITLTKPGKVPLDVTNVAWEVTEGVFSFPTFSKTLNQNLEQLLAEENRNYWLSGHTHARTTPTPSKIVVGGLLGEKYYSGINTGSTTDYRAHAVIVESCERHKNNHIDSFLGYREIPILDYREDLLAATLRAIAEYGREHRTDPNFQNVLVNMDQWKEEQESVDLLAASVATVTMKPGNLLDTGFSSLGFKPKDPVGPEQRYWIDVGATILGLNKRYQADAWKDSQTEASAQHLRTFVQLLVGQEGQLRDDVIACLGLLAGAYECGRLPKGCDFAPDCLRKICTHPQ